MVRIFVVIDLKFGKWLIYLGIAVALVIIFQGKEERIRIISEDNQEMSLIEKEQVKEIVVDYLQSNKEIKVDEIKTIIESIYPDRVTVKMEDHSFPPKLLSGKIIPAGVYKTLVVEIGAANGSNWWCLLYPDYFGLNFDSSSEIIIKSYFVEMWK